MDAALYFPKVKEHMHTKLLATGLLLLTYTMFTVGNEWQRRSIKRIEDSSKTSPVTTAAPAPDTASQIKVIRDTFKLFLVCGGAFTGAAISVMIRRTVTKELDGYFTAAATSGFTIALFTAIGLMPMILQKCGLNSDEESFGYTFLFAICSYWIWEIVFIEITRIKAAAANEGIKGVRDEIMILCTLGIWQVKK